VYPKLPYRASLRIPPNRRPARVVADFWPPLLTPTLLPPLSMFSPGREGGDWACGLRCGCLVFLPAIQEYIATVAENRLPKNEQLFRVIYTGTVSLSTAGRIDTRMLLR